MSRRAEGRRITRRSVDTGPRPLIRSKCQRGVHPLWRTRALSSCRRFGWAVVASVLVCPLVCAAPPADDGGGLVGLGREHARRARSPAPSSPSSARASAAAASSRSPTARGSSCSPRCPPGSYTLRAIGTGHQPSAAQHVTVLPNRDALFTLSLTPVGEKPAAEAAPTRGDAVRGRARVALAGAPQAALRPGDGRPRRAATADEHAGARRSRGRPRSPTLGPVAGSMELAATGGHAVAGRRRGSGPARRGRLAPPAGPAGRRRPLEPGRAGRRERGAGLAHGGRVRARARRRARGRGRRRLRGRRHARRRSPAALARARPRGRGGLRPGPLAARRAADRDRRRPLHLHRLPARLAPRRRGACRSSCAGTRGPSCAARSRRAPSPRAATC